MVKLVYGRNVTSYKERQRLEESSVLYQVSLLPLGHTGSGTSWKVFRVYDRAYSSIRNLQRRGPSVLYKVDATRLHEIEELSARKFDRIVFNLPHAGFFGGGERIKKKNELLSMFFKSATKLLSIYGEIHVTNKVGPPYREWNLEGKAEKYGLYLKKSVRFRKTDYPGYMNVRGSEAQINRNFRLGECRTYMFSKYAL
ncbi:hypothetical protein SUGI_0086650 [Cryptomeria japonica]|nr:hypothetical protein SUGI_0086650 [Cryptomeria japonica]